MEDLSSDLVWVASFLVSRFLVPQVISSVLQNAFTCGGRMRRRAARQRCMSPCGLHASALSPANCHPAAAAFCCKQPTWRMFQKMGWVIQYWMKEPAMASPSPCSRPETMMEPTTRMTPMREMEVKMELTE